jgi:hypothetical protein|tara:strand:- start:1515 stop:1904 length:390 start_codon:yes stop_codon:yes gene_type:complete
MSDITVITPPDKIFNEKINIFLLYPSNKIKTDLQDILAEITTKVNVYIYEKKDEHDVDWLLSVQKMSDISIIELDQLPNEIKQIESYLISQSNTYWLTKGDNIWYNKLNVNRVYDLHFLNSKLGGTVEK